jgi:hypothetical protein
VPACARCCAILADLADHFGDIDAPPPLMDLPGMTVEQLRSFFEAAAEYFRRMPWRQVLGDEPIKAECDKFENGTWYAVVMGQSGMTLGLALYEHFRELKRLLSSHDPDEERAGMASALSLMYSEAFQIDPRDFDTAKKHKFPVGSPEAYPMVIRTNLGGAMRGPLAWELEMLEGFLRAIPDFLVAKVESQTMEVGTAKGPLTVRLSRVTV